MADKPIVYPDQDGGIAVCWSWAKVAAAGGYGSMRDNIAHVHLVGADSKTLCGCKTKGRGVLWEFDYWMPNNRTLGRIVDPNMDSVTCERCRKANKAHAPTP